MPSDWMITLHLMLAQNTDMLHNKEVRIIL